MQSITKSVSALALIGIVVPPAFYLAGRLPPDGTKLWMLVATIAWFATVPCWMGRKPEP